MPTVTQRQPGRPAAANLFTAPVLVGALTLAIGFTAVKGVVTDAFGSKGPQPNVPTQTIDYLKTLPTEESEVPTGGGLDDAALDVDPNTYTESTHIHDGIKQLLAAQVGKTESGVPIPQAGQELDVPIVPPLDQVPPEAR